MKFVYKEQLIRKGGLTFSELKKQPYQNLKSLETFAICSFNFPAAITEQVLSQSQVYGSLNGLVLKCHSGLFGRGSTRGVGGLRGAEIDLSQPL